MFQCIINQGDELLDAGKMRFKMNNKKWKKERNVEKKKLTTGIKTQLDFYLKTKSEQIICTEELHMLYTWMQ